MKRFAWLMGLCMAGVLGVPNVQAQPSNGDFESGLTDWTTNGGVSVVNADTNPVALLEEPAPPGEGGDPTGSPGGWSRLYQEFDLPDPPDWLSFRYRLTSGPGARPGGVPPDSFTAYLLDQGSLERLVVPADKPPSFSSGFLYADSDGQISYDPDHVTVANHPDANGMTVVVLDVSSLDPPAYVRAEFGLAEAGNQIQSFALVDEVRTSCPPEFCCSPGNAVEIDDSDPCTQDLCNSDGTVDHIDYCEDDCNADDIPDACQVCSGATITFEELPAGTIMDSLCTVGVTGWNSGVSDWGYAVVFDSSNPSGGDVDLGTPNEGFEIAPGVSGPGQGEGGQPGSSCANSTPLGNILIIAHDLTDADSDGLVDDPNDEDAGGWLGFDFIASGIGPVTAQSATVIDIEATNHAIILDDGSPNQTAFISFTTGDNGVRLVEFGDMPGVESMTFEPDGSGAIDNIRFIAKNCLQDNNADGLADDCQQIPQIVRVESAADHAGVTYRLPLTEQQDCPYAPPTSDVEPRGPGVTRLLVTFDLPMDPTTAEDASNVSVIGINQLPPDVSVTPVLGVSGLELALNISPALPDSDCYTVDLAGMTAGGVRIDPTASTFTVRALQGDVQRDGNVNTTDLSKLKAHLGDQTDACNARFDFNVDGMIDSSDRSQVKLRLGHVAPDCP